jgi:PKHD-type hydroxylase
MQLLLPHRNSPGKDNLAYWENFLTEQEIQTILSLPEWGDTSPAVIGGREGKFTPQVEESIRKSGVAWLEKSPHTQHIFEKIVNVINEVNRTFFKFDLTGLFEAAQLTTYSADRNDFYTWHIDGSLKDPNVVPRKLSMTLLLSDPSEFEGGQFQIKTVSDSPFIVEQKRGRAWFFPSYHLHRVTPVTKGVRKSLVLWIGGPEFK